MAIDFDWCGQVDGFLRADPHAIASGLAHAVQRRHRSNQPTQLRAWAAQVAILADALGTLPDAAGWTLMFEVALRRTPRRADAVLLAHGTIVVMEFKIGAAAFNPADRAQVDDFALALQDFHVGSRGRPILPVLVASEALRSGPAQPALQIGGVAPVVDCTVAMLAELLGSLAPQPAIDAPAWIAAPYRPVPPIIDAATALYARHDVDDIVDARAGAISLADTSGAIHAALADARARGRRLILFVTGVPGAGKTLCGLNACFGAAADDLRATFLTGNPALVHVLREALVRDAVRRGADRRSVAARMQGVIQSLPAFRDLYVRHPDQCPPERVVVIDEAQRSWARDYAIRKSVDRPVPLSDSEPGHLLAALARHPDWCALICLVGNGQEIHDGEGGLAEWGAALAAAPGWDVIAAPDCLTQTVARRRLPALPGLRTDPRLHLSVPTRQIGHPAASDWVEAVLEGDAARAAGIAAADGGTLPYLLVRDLAGLRGGLRQLARGTRRAGLIASSGASRLRAIGLGAELPHMDAAAVARWFLDRWPDVRASDALELLGTEFAVQGLELDVVGLCWDGDLIRLPGRRGWHARQFRGSAWQNTASADKAANRINTYRVLLTRARHETVICVPRGDPADATRDPATLDGIAAFLLACGVRAWVEAGAGAAGDLPPAVPRAPLLAGLEEMGA